MVTMIPLMKPNKRPNRVPKRTANPGGNAGLSRINMPMTMATNPMFEPTDKSMLAVNMTIIWPMATMDKIEMSSRMSRKFEGVRNNYGGY